VTPDALHIELGYEAEEDGRSCRLSGPSPQMDELIAALMEDHQ